MMRVVGRASVLSLVLAAVGCGSDESSGGSTQGGTGGSGATGGAGGSGGTTENPADYLDRPLTEQVTAITEGKITSDGLTLAYLDRVATRDPDFHAVLLQNPNASAEATTLDAETTKAGKLFGVSILVKDNIDTKGLATTAGSLALENNVPASDAFVMARVHAENGVVLGKTNLSEWAHFRGYYASSGWSSLGGQTNNGADPAYNPCGSSSGSGAAVAAGMCSAALGTETDGSIVCPATVNGVVGFKPTVGLVSRAGVIPISDSQDTVGPITKNVRDAARLMSVLAGPDPADPATSAIPSGMSLDFEANLESASLSGKRLGIVSLGVPIAVNNVFNDTKARLEAAGAILVEVQLDKNSFGADESTILLHEFKVGINAYLGSHLVTGQPTTLSELIAFNEANAAEVMPYFGQELFLEAEATTGLDAAAYLTAKQNAQSATRENGIDLALGSESLDALIAPTGGTAWVTDLENGDAGVQLISSPAAVAGYPHITVPMGLAKGLPVGLSIFASAWQDAEVLALAYAFEQLPE
jgi:amidase